MIKKQTDKQMLPKGSVTTRHVAGLSFLALAWTWTENYARRFCTIIHNDVYYHRGRSVPQDILDNYKTFHHHNNHNPPQHNPPQQKDTPLRVHTFPVSPFF